MRVEALLTAEPESTGYYLIDAARQLGRVVYEGSAGRATDISTTDLLFYADPGPRRFPTNIHAHPGIRCAYFIDVHMDLGARLQLAPLFDAVFVAQRDYVARFRESGIENVHWLPLAGDPSIHWVPGLSRDLDVGFVGQLGLPGTARRHILTSVLSSFATNDVLRFYQRREMGTVYSRSKVVLNASLNGDLNMRVFEALTAGALLVTDRIENGLAELMREDVHYVGYSSPEEACEKIRWYLAHAEERCRIARAGQDLAHNTHSYVHRWQRIEQVASDTRKRQGKGSSSSDVPRLYADILANRRDPLGILALMAEGRLGMRSIPQLARAIAKALNARVPVTPNALRYWLRSRGFA